MTNANMIETLVTYDDACTAIDTWRGAGYKTQRTVSAHGTPEGVTLYAFNKATRVALGKGADLEAATIALALALPLPAPARVPVEPAQPAGHGREPSGVHETVRPRHGG